ncbi:MAG: hypothetical protein DRN18_02710 [Thermoplasmata archaeon]|nr:MAG: hypothetical protein DRN18_02710 [Thermoplasmata archaeon]
MSERAMKICVALAGIMLVASVLSSIIQGVDLVFNCLIMVGGGVGGFLIYSKLSYRGKRIFMGNLMLLYFLALVLLIFLVFSGASYFLFDIPVAILGIVLIYIFLTRILPRKEEVED